MGKRRTFCGLVAGVVFAVTAGLSFTPTDVYAQPASPTVEDLNQQGIQMFKDGSYREAIDRFNRAYAIEADPNLLFNIARCYEQLDEVDAAIAKYEEFLLKSGISPTSKVKAENRVKELKATKSAPPPEAPGSQPTSTPTAPASPEPTPAPIAEESSSNGTWGWVLLSTGVVAGGVGTVFYLKGVSDHNAVEDDPAYSGGTATMTVSEAQDKVDSGDSNKMLGGILWGLGGAALVGSVVMFSMGDSSKNEVGPTALGVSPMPSGGFASLRGRF